MDFSNQLGKEVNETNLENDPGVQELEAVQAQEEDDAKVEQKGKFDAAFSGSTLAADGPSADDYDYDSEFKDIGSFNTDDDGGVNLSNKNMRPDVHSIAGYDSVTGKQYTKDFYDPGGMIKQGIGELQNSSVNTKTGAPPKDMLSLSKVAQGIDAQDKTYDDFIKQTQGSWTDSQRAIAWDGMKQAKQMTHDVRDNGVRHLRSADSIVYNRMDGVIDDIDEGELLTDANWQKSGRSVAEYFNPGSSEGMNEQEIHDYNLDLMSSFNYNIPMMMFYTNEVLNSDDPDLAKNFLYLMDQNQATNVSWSSAGRAIGGMATDPITYASMGGSVLVSRLAGAGMKAGIKQVLTKLAAVTVADSVVGGAMGAGQDVAGQKVEIAAGERDTVDKGQAATAGAIGAGATALLGTASAAVFDPALRQFGMKAMRDSMNKSKFTTPTARVPVADAPAPVFDSPIPDVQYKSRLDEGIDKVFADSNKTKVSVANLQSQAKKWVKDGTVKQEEVDWAGLNMLEPTDKIDQAEIRSFVEYNRPVPTLDKTVTNEFRHMSHTGQGYREYVITLDNVGDYSGPDAHFGGSALAGGSTVGRGNANVGHLRLEDSYSGADKGTMFLEGQADIVKEKLLKANTPAGKAIKEPADQVKVNEANKRLEKSKSNRDTYRLEMQKVYGNEGDEFFGNTYRQLSTEQKAKYNILEKAENDRYDDLMTVEGKIPLTPFRKRKTSGALLFRSAIMEAMNSDSKFLAWPKTHEQVAYVEQWKKQGAQDINAQRYKDASKFMTKDMRKFAESHGFKVEEYVPDELKQKITQYEILDVGTRDKATFDSRNELDKYAMETYDTNIDLAIANGSMEVISEKEIPLSDITGGDKYLRIKFTDEQKREWSEKGAAMYSFGAIGAAGAAATGTKRKKQNRDKDGKFI